jgi:hypothetical protein
VLRARVTWLVASLAALLIGHGFVLALNVYAATSRSVLGSVLEAPGLDPLLGIVRPTLGGVSFSLALLGPILASRSLAVEKERNTYGASCLASGTSQRVVLEKWLASALACGLPFVPALLLFVGFGIAGGHLDWPEVMVALGGELLHLLVITSAAVAAAAWTRTVAQAITVALLLSLSAWAIDAAEGFAALSWLGGASSARATLAAVRARRRCARLAALAVRRSRYVRWIGARGWQFCASPTEMVVGSRARNARRDRSFDLRPHSPRF